MPAQSEKARERLREAKRLFVAAGKPLDCDGVAEIEGAVHALFEAAVAEVRLLHFQGWDGWPTAPNTKGATK